MCFTSTLIHLFRSEFAGLSEFSGKTAGIWWLRERVRGQICFLGIPGFQDSRDPLLLPGLLRSAALILRLPFTRVLDFPFRNSDNP